MKLTVLIWILLSSAQWGSAPAQAIRSEDAAIRSLLDQGYRQSPTLRQLVDAIGRTDGLVYISRGSCRVRALRGCLLHTIEDTGNARYLRIRVGANSDSSELIVTLAHELQHALEVLTRPEIRTQRDLLDFYASLESDSFSGGSSVSVHRIYETHAAIEIATVVRSELSAATGEVTAGDRD